MKKNYTIYQVDAFTREKLAGNPAGVVPDARGLTEGQMQRIARELNNSETAFLFPGKEGPFCCPEKGACPGGRFVLSSIPCGKNGPQLETGK